MIKSLIKNIYSKSENKSKNINNINIFYEKEMRYISNWNRIITDGFFGLHDYLYIGWTNNDNLYNPLNIIYTKTINSKLPITQKTHYWISKTNLSSELFYKSLKYINLFKPLSLTNYIKYVIEIVSKIFCIAFYLPILRSLHVN